MLDKIILFPLLGRILFAVLFIPAGISKVTGFAGTSGYIASKGLPAPDVLAVLTIIVEIGAGLLLLVGWKARWAALALAVFTILAAVLFHNFWAMEGAAVGPQRINFMKNLAIAGGLFAFTFFGAGPLSVDRK